jgi:hypothetical protein
MLLVLPDEKNCGYRVVPRVVDLEHPLIHPVILQKHHVGAVRVAFEDPDVIGKIGNRFVKAGFDDDLCLAFPYDFHETCTAILFLKYFLLEHT